jgi:hypothetical protein
MTSSTRSRFSGNPLKRAKAIAPQRMRCVLPSTMQRSKLSRGARATIPLRGQGAISNYLLTSSATRLRVRYLEGIIPRVGRALVHRHLPSGVAWST